MDPGEERTERGPHKIAAGDGNRADRADLEEAAGCDPGDLEGRATDTSYCGRLKHQEVMKKHAADEEQDDRPSIGGLG